MNLSHEERVALGRNIVRARTRKGWTQADLAQALASRRGDGIDPTSIRRSLVNNESGKFSPHKRTLEAIADVTEQPMSFFLPVSEVAEGAAPFRSAD